MKQMVLTRKLKQVLSEKKAEENILFAIVGIVATVIHHGIYYFIEKTINVSIAYTIQKQEQ